VGPIIVVDYDPSWPGEFERLKAAIWPALADVATSIQHVGSTAVKGLAAKPVIDLDVVAPAHQLATCIARLATLGYQHQGDCGVPQREAFRSPAGSVSHHLYLCPETSPALANHLAIRDYLRNDAAQARAYGDLKKRLAIEFSNDRAGYVEAKTAFLVAILHKSGLAAETLAEIERINRRPGPA
jgi:GrpB-like predicted nucleotidyltransferase (UPF0157 family)